MKRDTSVWPFTLMGTLILIPIMAVGIVAAIYGGAYLVQFLGETAVNAAKALQ